MIKLVSRAVKLDSFSVKTLLHACVYSLEIDEAIAANDNVTAIVGVEWGFHKGSRADFTHHLLQQLVAHVGNLLIRHRLRIEVVVVLSDSAGPMAGFHQPGDDGIIPEDG